MCALDYLVETTGYRGPLNDAAVHRMVGILAGQVYDLLEEAGELVAAGEDVSRVERELDERVAILVLYGDYSETQGLEGAFARIWDE